MKTLLLSLLLALAFLNLPHDAHAWDDYACENSCWGDLAIEGRVAYYRPSSKKVKEIYGNGWADYQIELSKGFCQNWRAWIGVSGFHKGGRSLGGHDKTSIRLIPVTLGIKYL